VDTTELRKAYESVAVEYEAGGFGSSSARYAPRPDASVSVT
jgi:hypothetical protein